jgi:hypothetical protein
VRSYEKVNFFEYSKLFGKGRSYVKEDERSCRPRSHRTDENVEKVWDLVRSDRRLSIRGMGM